MKYARRDASTQLEAWMDECYRVAVEAGFRPHIFSRMRREQGTWQAMVKLVESGDLQTGFTQLKDLGLLDYSIEAAIVKFAPEFYDGTVQCAKWRLKQVA